MRGFPLDFGELRTAIIVKLPPMIEDEAGFSRADHENAVNIFGEGVTVPCKWVNSYGQELIITASLNYKDAATLTMRYTPKIDSNCIIYLVGDPVPFEVIGMDNIRQRNQLMQIKIKRVELSGNSI